MGERDRAKSQQPGLGIRKLGKGERVTVQLFGRVHPDLRGWRQFWRQWRRKQGGVLSDLIRRGALALRPTCRDALMKTF